MEYTGRLSYAPFAAWVESPEGRPVLEEIASRVRFAPFGKLRAARRRVWRELKGAARTGRVVLAVQTEIDAYLSRLDTLVYARDLPRIGVQLHRLVVVPRRFVNSDAFRRIDEALSANGVFALLDCDKAVRHWFTSTLVSEVDGAVTSAGPSVRTPVPAGEGWIIVGVNEQFDWYTPPTGPAWPGHYYVLERTRWPITRKVRKAVGDAIVQLEGSLQSLSRVRRNEIVKGAWLSLEQLFA
jgi:hypothetical protein